MHFELFREYCLEKKGVTDSLPFGPHFLVFKLEQKMFALLNLNNHSANLKCNPDKAIYLRSKYSGISSGYHMNKQHWNTINFNEDVEDAVIFQLIDESYELIMKGLSKKKQLKYQLSEE